jgi:hypothetical protein
MNKFISIDYNRSVLNLANVTNIAFLEKHNRIVFNFANNIEIKSSKGIQVIADYRYDDYNSSTEFKARQEELIKVLDEYGYIKPMYSQYNHHWVNPSHVTFINVDKKRNRIMFNLSNSVTKLVDNEVMLVNDFVFWNCTSEEETVQATNYVFNLMK